MAGCSGSADVSAAATVSVAGIGICFAAVERTVVTVGETGIAGSDCAVAINASRYIVVYRAGVSATAAVGVAGRSICFAAIARIAIAVGEVGKACGDLASADDAVCRRIRKIADVAARAAVVNVVLCIGGARGGGSGARRDKSGDDGQRQHRSQADFANHFAARQTGKMCAFFAFDQITGVKLIECKKNQIVGVFVAAFQFADGSFAVAVLENNTQRFVQTKGFICLKIIDQNFIFEFLYDDIFVVRFW